MVAGTLRIFLRLSRKKKFAILRISGATNCVSVGLILAALHAAVGKWRTDKVPIKKRAKICIQ